MCVAAGTASGDISQGQAARASMKNDVWVAANRARAPTSFFGMLYDACNATQQHEGDCTARVSFPKMHS